MKQKQLKNNNPTIAVLTNMMSTSYSEGIIFGATDYAKQHNYNSLCFAGSAFSPPDNASMSRDRIFDLIDPKLVDGIIVPMGALSRFITIEQQLAFLDRFSDMPIVTVTSFIDGYMDVGYSARQGMFELVDHLYQHHNVTRFSFTGTTGSHKTSLIKKQFFVEALKAKGITYDENLELTCELRPGATVIGLEKLFSGKRETWPQALVAASDNQAQSIIASLAYLDIKVPKDVIVTGSSGGADSLFTEPPLTSITEPTYELGWNAAERLIADIECRPFQDNLVLPSSLIIRRSCGCNQAVENVQNLINDITAPIAQSSAPINCDEVTAKLTSVFNGMLPERRGDVSDEVPKLMASFLFSDIREGALNKLPSFLHRELEDSLKSDDVYMLGEMALALHNILMKHTLAEQGETIEKVLASALFLIVQSCNEKACRYRRSEAKRYVGTMRELGLQLNSDFKLSEISQLLSFGLNITDFYISVFEGDFDINSQAQSVLAMRGGKRLLNGGGSFPARNLIPPFAPDYDDVYALVVMPLSFELDFFGLCVLNMNDRKGLVYESMLTLFSSALKNQIHVRELKAQEAKIRTLAYSDKLTELPNRSLLNDKLCDEVQYSLQEHKQFAVLFIDLDGFKDVNDSLGHAAGDMLLVKVAKIFSSCIRDHDTLGRYGGDEFIGVLPNINDENDAKMVAERIVRAVAKPIELNGHCVEITASIGIALYPKDGCTAESLINSSDKAMYQSKQTGKNRYSFYQRG